MRVFRRPFERWWPDMHLEWIPGKLQANEGFLVCRPRRPITVPKTPIMFCPQAAGLASYFLNPLDPTRGVRARILRQLCEDLGTVCVSSDMGGANGFGAPASTARVKAVYDWLQTQPGVAQGRVLCVGTSMGNMTALRFALDYPGRVIGILSFFGMSDPVTIYNQNLGGVQAALGAAWGVVYPAPLPLGADLISIAGGGAFDALDWLGYSGTGDALVPPQSQLAFSEAMGDNAEYHSTGATGHGDDTIAAAPYEEYKAFLQARL